MGIQESQQDDLFHWPPSDLSLQETKLALLEYHTNVLSAMLTSTQNQELRDLYQKLPNKKLCTVLKSRKYPPKNGKLHISPMEAIPGFETLDSYAASQLFSKLQEVQFYVQTKIIHTVSEPVIFDVADFSAYEEINIESHIINSAIKSLDTTFRAKLANMLASRYLFVEPARDYLFDILASHFAEEERDEDEDEDEDEEFPEEGEYLKEELMLWQQKEQMQEKQSEAPQLTSRDAQAFYEYAALQHFFEAVVDGNLG